MLHMRGLHGIVRFGCPEEQLKRQAIVFDRFHVVHDHFGFGPPNDAQNAAEWDALETLGIAERVPERFGDEVTMAELRQDLGSKAHSPQPHTQAVESPQGGD